jgi:hypothetical protein
MTIKHIKDRDMIGICGACGAVFEANREDFDNTLMTVWDCQVCGENDSVPFYDKSPSHRLLFDEIKR